MNFDEPFKRLLTQGMVLKNGAVMSKSKGNVVDPDDMLAKYGADALRLYVMFVAPPEKEVEWSDSGLEGSFRFLLRVWRLVDHWAETIGGEGVPACGADCTDAERALRRKTHDTIRRVTVDIEERMHLNTAVSSLMELVNELYAFSEGTPHGAPSRAEAPVGRIERTQTIAVLREAIDALVLMISPFAPHTAEELWQMLGHPESLAAGVVAGVRPRGRPGRRGRRAGADQRQGPRAPHRARGAVRRRSCRIARWRTRPSRRIRPARRSVRWSSRRDRLSVWWLDSPRGRRGSRGRRAQRREASASAASASFASSASSAPGAATRWPAAGRSCPTSIRTIGVPTFGNRTTVFNLETQLTQKVRSEFIGRGRYRILPEAGTDVDALLTGEVTAVTITPASFNTAPARHPAT